MNDYEKLLEKSKEQLAKTKAFSDEMHENFKMAALHQQKVAEALRQVKSKH